MFIYKCHCFLNKQKRSTFISSGHTQGTVREASGLVCWPQTTDRPGYGIALCGLQSSSVALGPHRTTCLDHWSEPCCTFHPSVSSGTCPGLLRAWFLHLVITCSAPSSLSAAVLLVRSGSSFSITTQTYLLPTPLRAMVAIFSIPLMLSVEYSQNVPKFLRDH